MNKRLKETNLLARTIIVALLMCLAASALAESRESFNQDWRFARFGPMPDGAILPEPGAGGWSIRATASSEEAGKGNYATCAVDGDPGTRWCAANGSAPQWLQLELDQPQTISRAAIQWENAESKYEFNVEGSLDGKAWKPLPATARLVRVNVTGLPAGQWASIREVQLFDEAGKVIANRKTAASQAPDAADYNDTTWRKLDVPHDWAIAGPFRYDLDGDTGKLPWSGIGWYRKHFNVPASDAGRCVFVDFDGAMANAKVWCNGQYVGTWPYGYQGFRLELTPFLKFGAENVLAVRLDTTKWGSRWYPGAGIYRNVWLVKTAPVHVGHWGVCVTTHKVTPAAAEVKMAVTIDNQTARQVQAGVMVEVYEQHPDGTLGPKVATVPSSDSARLCNILSGTNTTVELVASVPKARLWDLKTPNLYTARAIVSGVAGEIVDTQDTPFGIRTLEFTPRDGFKLNGRRVQIQGTCNHHDLGALGAALNTRALERQLEILKEMGDNALRTSHNPPAPELLELADRMGLLVMCEAFDCWRSGKTANDYSQLFDQWHTRDLQAMVRHFRNHPSVIMWSIGNEIHEQGGPDMARMLRDIVHAEDPTRPVTAGCDNPRAGTNGFQHAVDVFGLNYHIGDYPKLLSYPGNEDRAFQGSETASCISSRGEYFFGGNRVGFQVSSYDLDYPSWASTPDAEFRALDQNPAFLGEFVWTGFDYLGEPTPYGDDLTRLPAIPGLAPEKLAAMKQELEESGRIRCASRSSYFGIVDLAGFKKSRFYLYQARWRPDLPMAHILPHWNWPERVGQVTPVHVYTSGDEAELFLNGQSLGRKKKGAFEYRLRWDDVKYEPGTLKVVACKAGHEWASDTVKTTGPAAKLLLEADRPEIRADGRDLSFLTVRVADQDGLTVPRSYNLVKFSIVGPGEIVAVDNGDATSLEPFQASQHTAFNGLALVIVRAKPGQPGAIRLTAASDGLQAGTVSVSAVR